jgi:2-methylisocitrate lyase-like PEP mutase family enzyme
MIASTSAQLRALLARPQCTIAPGVADGLAARLVKLSGFEAVYMTGFGTSLTRLGMPMWDLLTASEMIDNASRIVDASELPVVADADTGYGNPINTRRTIRDYEKAGRRRRPHRGPELAQALRTPRRQTRYSDC